MRDLSDIVLRPSDFGALAKACQFDNKFPEDFNGWSDLMRQAEADARKLKLFPAPLMLDPADFAAWCESVQVIPCIDAMRAYAIVKRGRLPNH